MKKIPARRLQNGQYILLKNLRVGPITVTAPGTGLLGTGAPDPSKVHISGRTPDGRPIGITRGADEGVTIA